MHQILFIEMPNSYSNNLIENFDWFMMASFTFSIFFADLARPDRLSSFIMLISFYPQNVQLVNLCTTVYGIDNHPHTQFLSIETFR